MADLILGSPKYPVRLSYINIWEPQIDKKTGDSSWNAMILIDKRDKQTIRLIKEAEEEAKEKALANPKAWAGKMPKDLKSVIKDGDDYDGEGDPEPLVGMWYLNANNRRRRPGIVDNNVKPLSAMNPADKEKLYSGVMAYVNISVFGYSAEEGKKKGLGVGLENIQTLGYGENLGGGAKAPETVFGKVALPDQDEDEDDDLM